MLVVTPAIFLHLLSRGFVRMGEISLIVFDECHHTRKDHPYNQIMRDFYHAPDAHTSSATVETIGVQRPGRPKIFGMTASPVHMKVHSVRMRLRTQPVTRSSTNHHAWWRVDK